jgi:hypothetical protein
MSASDSGVKDRLMEMTVRQSDGSKTNSVHLQQLQVLGIAS